VAKISKKDQYSNQGSLKCYFEKKNLYLGIESALKTLPYYLHTALTAVIAVHIGKSAEKFP
jgi:hypothetical protein